MPRISVCKIKGLSVSLAECDAASNRKKSKISTITKTPRIA